MNFYKQLKHALLKRGANNIAVVSFPKAGRTWLRVMLDMCNVSAVYTHDQSAHRLAIPFGDLSADKAEFRENRVIFLVRDPRDVAVSGYFQATKRIGAYNGSISDFVRSPKHGVEKSITFNKGWFSCKSVPENFLLLEYEKMRKDPVAELRRVLAFSKARLSDRAIAIAVERASFKNMQAQEKSSALTKKYGHVLSPGDVNDVESFKVRRGKVGGYSDYLSQEDQAYCAEVLARTQYEEALAAVRGD